MDRNQFSKVLRGFTWLLIIASFITPFRVFGIELFWIVIPLIFLRRPLVNWIYGPPKKQQERGNQYSQTQQNSDNQYTQTQPYQSPQHSMDSQNTTNPSKKACPQCGNMNFAEANFCEECGTSIAQTK